MADHGSYHDERQAHAAAIAAIPPEDGRSILRDSQNRQLIEDACAAAGVGLGAHDRRIIDWLAGFEDSTCAVFAGLIMRAWDPSSPLAHCRHCGTGIEPCPHARGAMPVCKGWRHEGHEDQPVGSHYCGGRSVSPSAEPAVQTETTKDAGH